MLQDWCPTELRFGSWTSLTGAQFCVPAYTKAFYQELSSKAESLVRKKVQ